MSRLISADVGGAPTGRLLRSMGEELRPCWQLFILQSDQTPCLRDTPARPFTGSARIHLFAFSGPCAIAGSCLAGAGGATAFATLASFNFWPRSGNAVAVARPVGALLTSP